MSLFWLLMEFNFLQIYFHVLNIQTFCYLFSFEEDLLTSRLLKPSRRSRPLAFVSESLPSWKLKCSRFVSPHEGKRLERRNISTNLWLNSTRDQTDVQLDRTTGSESWWEASSDSSFYTEISEFSFFVLGDSYVFSFTDVSQATKCSESALFKLVELI